MKCDHCNGTGQVPGKVGARLRIARKRACIGLREMAARLQVSSGYLHDLEHGRRNWTEILVSKYQKALYAKN